MLRVLLVLGVVTLLVPLTPALGFVADFFDGSASGNAVYEDMAIRPEAIYDAVTGKTIVAYQGFGMHPFVAAYDQDTGEWEGPYQVGTNPLDDDAHGGPSLVIDADGYIHVFYGAHGVSMMQARSTLPHDISAWDDLGTIRAEWRSGETTVTGVIPATYPQPFLTADGMLRLFYRSSWNGYWYSVVSTDGAGVWTGQETVLQGDSTKEWFYANFSQSAGGDIHNVFLMRDFAEAPASSDYFIRRNAYYMREDAATGEWLTAAGESAPTTMTREAVDASCTVYNSGVEYLNQVVVRDSGDGPCVLFVTGSHEPTPTYTWQFTRWSSDDATWTAPVDIVETDHFFDAGTFQVLPDGTIEAFLTTGGVPDENATLSDVFLAARGGDIVRFTSSNGGASFQRRETLKSSPGPWARYSDPQIVEGYDDGPRVFFSEWNNDFANYMHKVFLWGDDGFVQREFTPESVRLAGANRTETAIEVSKEAFPSGASTVLIASRDNFPDALCGAPLAHAVRGPVLLTSPRSLDASVTEEIRRLWGKTPTPGTMKAIVLGSDKAVSSDVFGQLQSLLGWNNVSRLGGLTRYETSIKIQQKLATVRGVPTTIVVASGLNFPDALAISPVAARKNMPILLTDPSSLTTVTADAIVSVGASATVIVGGEAAVSESVEASLAALTPEKPPLRLGGDDRWETAKVIDDYALSQGLSLERFVLCTGENFPDALTGGVLAARLNAPMLLTNSEWLPQPTASILITRRPHTLTWYVLGSDTAVSPYVVNRIASYLPY